MFYLLEEAKKVVLQSLSPLDLFFFEPKCIILFIYFTLLGREGYLTYQFLNRINP